MSPKGRPAASAEILLRAENIMVFIMKGKLRAGLSLLQRCVFLSSLPGGELGLVVEMACRPGDPETTGPTEAQVAE